MATGKDCDVKFNTFAYGGSKPVIANNSIINISKSGRRGKFMDQISFCFESYHSFEGAVRNVIFEQTVTTNMPRFLTLSIFLTGN